MKHKLEYVSGCFVLMCDNIPIAHFGDGHNVTFLNGCPECGMYVSTHGTEGLSSRMINEEVYSDFIAREGNRLEKVYI